MDYRYSNQSFKVFLRIKQKKRNLNDESADFAYDYQEISCS